MPWYNQLKAAIAATEPASNLAIATIIAISILVLVKGSPAMKALWVVYVVSP
jgi:hypothetical protein